MVSGRLHGGERRRGRKPKAVGPGHDGAVADMTVVFVSGAAATRLTGFKVPQAAGGQAGGERNAAIAAVLATAERPR